MYPGFHIVSLCFRLSSLINKIMPLIKVSLLPDCIVIGDSLFAVKVKLRAFLEVIS